MVVGVSGGSLSHQLPGVFPVVLQEVRSVGYAADVERLPHQEGGPLGLELHVEVRGAWENTRERYGSATSSPATCTPWV